MVFKIRTSKKTQEFFEAIEASENLQPYALSKLAISLSLKSDEPMVESDFKTDNNGLELNRQTITGEYDELYKCLIAMKENRHIDDDEYFQKYITGPFQIILPFMTGRIINGNGKISHGCCPEPFFNLIPRRQQVT